MPVTIRGTPMIEYECDNCQASFMTIEEEMYEKCPFCGCEGFNILL